MISGASGISGANMSIKVAFQTAATQPVRTGLLMGAAALTSGYLIGSSINYFLDKIETGNPIQNFIEKLAR
jgi:hypothetical protein